MSALAGIVGFDGGPADVASVERMIDCVPQRGADWRGCWSDGSAALAYRWRRTGPAQPVDEQPLADRLTRTALVFDGRLDNRRELASQLDLRDEASAPDAALAFAALQRWGSDAVARLLGDFALAFWDARVREVILACDPRGVRAISYAATPTAITFATEPRQLLRTSGIHVRPNLGFLGERLTGVITHPSDTIFCGIARVPAAHMVVAGHAGVRVARYWDIDPSREIRYADGREYAEHLRELYDEALRARLRGLARVAVLLSGGVDSSSVVDVASRLNPGGRPVAVRAYTHALRGLPDGDEEREAREVADACGVPLVSIPFQAFHGPSLARHLDAARALEDSMPGVLGCSDFALASRMSEDDCRVVLLGIGGDEWFTGAFQHSADLIRQGRLVAGLRQLWADGHHPDAFHGVAVLARTCGWALLPLPVRRLIKRGLPARDPVPRGFNRAFAAEVSLAERVTPPPADPRFSTLAAGVMYRAGTHPHGIYAWDEGVRQASLFGSELSAPLLDRRIAEFAMAIPEEQRWSGRDTKRVLRAAMAGRVPDAVRMRRQKSDPAAAVFGELVRLHGQSLFADLELAEAGILDSAAVDSMYQEMVRLFGEGDVRYKVLATDLWAFFVGECVWRTLFGRNARISAGGFSGTGRPQAGTG